MKHKEIEKKYIFTDQKGHQLFQSKIKSLPSFSSATTLSTTSRDAYFLLGSSTHMAYRFRYDGTIQQLTAKSLREGFPLRTEINLELATDRLQREDVEAFLATLGIRWQGEIEKNLTIYRFATVEVVDYIARFGDKQLHCLEIEALAPTSIEQGLSYINAMEKQLEVFSFAQEASESLFHQLILPFLPAAIRGELEKKPS